MPSIASSHDRWTVRTTRSSSFDPETVCGRCVSATKQNPHRPGTAGARGLRSMEPPESRFGRASVREVMHPFACCELRNYHLPIGVRMGRAQATPSCCRRRRSRVANECGHRLPTLTIQHGRQLADNRKRQGPALTSPALSMPAGCRAQSGSVRQPKSCCRFSPGTWRAWPCRVETSPPVSRRGFPD